MIPQKSQAIYFRSFTTQIKPKLLGKNIYFTVKGTSVARLGFHTVLSLTLMVKIMLDR